MSISITISFNKLQHIFLIALLILCISETKSLAGGSMGYDDLRAKFPDNAITFDTLEQALDFEGGVWAETRIGTSISPKFGGMRIGPYYACAKQNLASTCWFW